MSREDFESYIPAVDERPNIKKVMLIGTLIVVVFFFGFVLWATFTRIDAAAMAQGKIVVEGQRQSVQHLEGGIIKKIYVHDGSSVKKGERLIQLDTTQATISLELMRNQIYELLALKGRLIAEKNNLPRITFDARLLQDKQTMQLEKLLKSQRAIFKANRAAFEGQIKILNFKISQLKEEINSFNSQLFSITEQVRFMEEELKAIQYLADKKLVEMPRLLALKRERARLIGSKGEFVGLIAKSKQQIAEAESQIITMDQERRKQVLAELRKTERELAEFSEKEKSVRDVLARSTIKAPQSGIVVGLQKHTESGVISPSQQILDIVPSQAELVVEARISPMDIDVVRPGLKAKLQLTAFKQRQTPSIEGEVMVVSADILKDEATGEQYYQVKIKGFSKELAKLKHVKLYPGMPVQVMIITENRSPMDYLLGPLADSLNRAFRES